MQKTPKFYQAGVRGRYHAILPRSASNNQVPNTSFSHCSHNNRLARLSAAIEQKNLHDCLSILEEVGFRNEIALFVLGYVQQALEVGL